jgi:hypothetical protein
MSVSEYLAALPAERRQAVSQVRSLIKKHLPKGYAETIQYGMISYVVPLATFPEGYLGKKDVPLPYLSLASQKSYLAVYLMGLYADPKLARWFTTAWKASGKKLDMGKSCLRFKAVSDLALDVLGEAVAKLPVQTFVAQYTAAHPSPRSAGAKTRTAKDSPPARSPKAAPKPRSSQNSSPKRRNSQNKLSARPKPAPKPGG